MPSQGQNKDVESRLLDWSLFEGLILCGQHIYVMDDHYPGVNLGGGGRRMKLRTVLQEVDKELGIYTVKRLTISWGCVYIANRVKCRYYCAQQAVAARPEHCVGDVSRLMSKHLINMRYTLWMRVPPWML